MGTLTKKELLSRAMEGPKAKEMEENPISDAEEELPPPLPAGDYVVCTGQDGSCLAKQCPYCLKFIKHPRGLGGHPSYCLAAKEAKALEKIPMGEQKQEGRVERYNMNTPRKGKGTEEVQAS